MGTACLGVDREGHTTRRRRWRCWNESCCCSQLDVGKWKWRKSERSPVSCGNENNGGKIFGLAWGVHLPSSLAVCPFIPSTITITTDLLINHEPSCRYRRPPTPTIVANKRKQINLHISSFSAISTRLPRLASSLNRPTHPQQPATAHSIYPTPKQDNFAPCSTMK